MNACARRSTRIVLFVITTLFFVSETRWLDPVRGQSLTSVTDHVALGLVLRQMNSVGTFMMVTAHPDDENNALLAFMSKGKGHQTALLTATRGDGGQNEIGTELFDSLAVLRSEELGAAHRLDGADQYFSRAVDFGYSFSVEETFEEWGREEILADFVRVVRTVRPDVIVGLSPEGQGGGQHHQASAVLAREAFDAAGDATRFPDQIDGGLHPWRPKKFYFMAGFPFGFGARRSQPSERDDGVVSVPLDLYDPLLGRTFAEIGSHARSMHKCQGTSQLLTLPGRYDATYRLMDTTIDGYSELMESSLFDGIDTTIPGLISFISQDGALPPNGFVDGLNLVARYATEARDVFETGGIALVRRAVLSGLGAVRNLRNELEAFGLSERARREIDSRLKAKEWQFERAVVLAYGLRLEVLVDDGLVSPGQSVTISALVANRGDADVSVRKLRFEGFDDISTECSGMTAASGETVFCEVDALIPLEAGTTNIHWSNVPNVARYAFEDDVPFGAPFRPTPYSATVDVDIEGVRLSISRPVEHRYVDDVFSGEKRMELQVFPGLAVELTPRIAIMPKSIEDDREVRVTVTNISRDPVDAEVSLTLPSGWEASPGSLQVSFTRENESRTLRFLVSSRDAGVGEYHIGAVARTAESSFNRHYQVVEYPHTARRPIVRVARAVFKVLDVNIVPDLSVGYIVGVGDEVPPAIEQLGASLQFLDADDLAWGDLSRFDVIVTGVRAYERRSDLRANNHRLLDYVERGGNVIVQYNKFEFNSDQYGPFPALVSRNRVTDEAAEINILRREHPIFLSPNAIDGTTWDGWVQERGLYFLGERDGAYVDLVELEDSFPYNAGMKRGALVEARLGDGRWFYLGLGLWRQLPAGTTGAYKLLANLLSLGAEP